MKLVFLILLSLLAVNSFLLRRPDSTENPNDAPSCISDYMAALWAHFDLDEPTQLINCFDDKSAQLYFKHLYQSAELARDSEDRRSLQVHLDLFKLAFSGKALQPTVTCMAHTQDWADLLEALGANKTDPYGFMLAQYIYFQANFGKLAEDLGEVTDALNHKNFSQAGDLIGESLNSTASDIKEEGVALLALKGLWNGVHIELDLPDAESIEKCWDNDTAALRLEFIYGMSVAVANGSIKDAAKNTKKWYNETGNDLLEKIGDDAWKCWANSTDTKNESKKLLIDISSHWFFSRVSKFVHEHPCAYWHIQNGIKSSLEQHNFLHAGSAYGHLLKAAASTS